MISVTQKVSLSSLVILKLGGGYKPILQDRIPFLNYGSVQAALANVKLFGAPFKNCEYSFIDGKGYFDVVFSYGSISSLGYNCDYLGDRKILESNFYVSQQKMVLSFTVPIRSDKLIAIGIDLNGNISKSWATIVSPNNDVQKTIMRDHFINQTDSPFFIIESTRSQSIFAVGPEYHTITLLIPDRLLISQKQVFYAEFPMNALPLAHDFHETFDYSVKNSEISECTNFLQPSRNAGESPAAIGVFLGIFLILIVICLILSPFRPMNTRGTSPTLTMVFLFIQMALEIRNHFEIPPFQGSLCVYLAYGVFPFQIVVYVMIFFYFLRYYAIINLNDNKREVATHGGRIVQHQFWSQFQRRFFKLLVSPWFSLSMTFAIYVFTNILFTIPLAATRYRCTFTILFVLKVFANLVLILIYLATIITFAVDLIRNYRLIIRFHWIEYIFKRDPYYFRLQSVFFFFYMLYNLITEFYMLFSTIDYFGVIKTHPATIAFETVSNILMILIIVLFPMFFTVIELITRLRERCKKPKRHDGLKSLFGDPEIAQLFRAFSEREWSIENVVIYEDLQIWKAKLDPEFAKGMFMKYLNGEKSVLEVNLPRAVSAEVKRRIDASDIDATLFDKVEQNIVANLSDTYGRFLQTGTYLSHVQKKKQHIEMIEGKAFN